MKLTEWQQNIKVVVAGAISSTDYGTGETTSRPPFREDGVIKVEIKNQLGRVRVVALSRVNGAR